MRSLPLLVTTCEDAPTPMTEPVVREVRASTIPPVASTPLLTSCLVGGGWSIAMPRLPSVHQPRKIPAATQPLACAHASHSPIDAIP